MSGSPAGKPRLALVVPYRNRQEHFNLFLPHVLKYFARDKADRSIPYSVTFVEQPSGLPFNAGMICNIGFLLVESNCDYVCIQDIDYLPIWADYSYVDAPTCILWYGAERQRVAPGSNRINVHNMEQLFGGAVLVRNADFRAVNGYSNGYWGWGYQDTDLRNRFHAMGMPIKRRKGTFQQLEHINRGFHSDGSSTPSAMRNARRFTEIWKSKQPDPADGLSTLRFVIVGRKLIDTSKEERPARVEIVTVDFANRPNFAFQAEAAGEAPL